MQSRKQGPTQFRLPFMYLNCGLRDYLTAVIIVVHANNKVVYRTLPNSSRGAYLISDPLGGATIRGGRLFEGGGAY